jgi:ribonucleotide monophosphatase NagD (HAD superfamily)
MHRNLWWMTPRGIALDAGAVVVGLEHALERRATVAGKPSPVVFREALRELAADVRVSGGPRLRAGEVAMVGDDLDSDVAGAHRVGLRGLLVLTGKTDAQGFAAAQAAGRVRGKAVPDGVADSLGAVVEQLIELRRDDPDGGLTGPRYGL